MDDGGLDGRHGCRGGLAGWACCRGGSCCQWVARLYETSLFLVVDGVGAIHRSRFSACDDFINIGIAEILDRFVGGGQF
jgi:hypothetical protein